MIHNYTFSYHRILKNCILDRPCFSIFFYSNFRRKSEFNFKFKINLKYIKRFVSGKIFDHRDHTFLISFIFFFFFFFLEKSSYGESNMRI